MWLAKMDQSDPDRVYLVEEKPFHYKCRIFFLMFGLCGVIADYIDPLLQHSTLARAGLLVLILARDIAIVAGAMMMATRGAASAIRPLPISKVNTAILIVFAGWLLAANAFEWSLPGVNYALIALVVFLTAVSAAAYVRLLIGGLGGTAAEQVGQPDET